MQSCKFCAMMHPRNYKMSVHVELSIGVYTVK